MLKSKIQEKTGIQPSHQILLWGGKPLLLDGPTLADYGMRDQITLNCVLRVRGGSRF